ncbi:MAG: response regulator, partial [Bacteroidota bacterium]
MKRYKTIVVEDEGPARRRIEALVDEHPHLALLDSFKNGLDAIKYIPKMHPDLLVMDIQLKDKTAFEVLESIHSTIVCPIIFITAFDQFALKAFEVAA